MFDELITCAVEDLYKEAEDISKTLKKEDVETFIRTLKKRVPELTVVQEKELHRLGRKILKQFDMKPIRD